MPKLRPWGSLDWVFNRLDCNRKWSLIGCLATEDRCLAALSRLKEKGLLANIKFLEILDPPSQLEDEAKKNRAIQRAKYINILGTDGTIELHDLEEEHYKIVNVIDQFIHDSLENVILDISSFPKRFFFPILKRLYLKKDKIRNLVVIYTTPEKYANRALSGNPREWDYLPLFKEEQFPAPDFSKAIVGVGFMAHGLPDLLKTESNKLEIFLLFPFPPGPPNYQRSWEFVRSMTKDRYIPNKNIIRCNAMDTSECFDLISTCTNFGKHRPLLVPYGPKPISLAMCIYAIQKELPASYMQPTFYDPLYSEGIKSLDDINTYCIRINGKDLYE